MSSELGLMHSTGAGNSDCDQLVAAKKNFWYFSCTLKEKRTHTFIICKKKEKRQKTNLLQFSVFKMYILCISSQNETMQGDRSHNS